MDPSFRLRLRRANVDVCMYVCMYAYMFVCTMLQKYMYGCLKEYLCIHICICMCIPAHTHTHTYIYIYIYI